MYQDNARFTNPVSIALVTLLIVCVSLLGSPLDALANGPSSSKPRQPEGMIEIDPDGLAAISDPDPIVGSGGEGMIEIDPDGICAA